MSLEVRERNFREDGWQSSSNPCADMVKGGINYGLDLEHNNNEEQMLSESPRVGLSDQGRTMRRSRDRRGVAQKPPGEDSWSYRSSSREGAKMWEFGGNGSREPNLPGNSEGLRLQRAPGTPAKSGAAGGGVTLSDKKMPRGGDLEDGCGTRRSQRKRKPVKGEGRSLMKRGTCGPEINI